VTDTARVLLTAAILSGATLAWFAWNLLRIDSDSAERMIGELRLAQWTATLLACIGAIPAGLAIVASTPTAGLDAALGIIMVGTAGLIMQREPTEALGLLARVFVLHALLDLAHRPGWLSPDLAPRWYIVGCAVYNVCLAAVCFSVKRR
jgi:hypothetical protein